MRDFHKGGRSPVYCRNGAVATSHPFATKVGIDILQAGGNAVDAAIATALVLNICEPQSTGLGGDLFAMLAWADRPDLVGLNASGRAPRGLDAEALRAAGHATIPLNDARAVTIPGAIDGFWRLHQDYGRLDWAAVLAPAIRAAEEGIPVAPRVLFDWDEAKDDLQGRARDFFLIDGALPRVGQVFAAPTQAEVLRLVAAKGRAGFYEGAVAEDMVASLRALGGAHELDDFAATKADYVTPIATNYRGAELLELPPNGQGATALLIANILSHFDIAALDPAGSMRAHLEAEAVKLAYDARNRFVADADYAHRLAHMLSPETATKLAALIDPDRAMEQVADRTDAIHQDTVCLSVIDRDQMAVSLIYSIFHSFGSGLASDRYGVLFQNRGAGFSLQRGHPNEAQGAKRPLHTIIPAILRHQGALIPFGVMGGAYQAAGHARFVSNLVDFGMDVQAAMEGARVFPDQGLLQVERGQEADVLRALEAKGHRLTYPWRAIGGAQAVRLFPDGLIEAGSDPRKDGIALGY